MTNKLAAIMMTAVAVFSLLVFAGCDSDAKTGALIGTAVGAGLGQAIGGDTEATLIGAGAGAAGGYFIGNEQDKKKAKTSAAESLDVVTVNITNSNGSITPVRLKKQGIGFIGPKGEYYDHLPTQQELKPVYGF